MQEGPEVPSDFPQEFAGAVPGAQPKLLVRLDSEGRFVDEAASARQERWLICFDLREQLVDYVNKHLPTHLSRAAYAEQVVLAVERKRAGWGISSAEAVWLGNEVRKHFAA